MVIIAIILSSLALLAAAAVLALFLRERKRSQKRNAAVMQYADKAAEAVRTELGQYTDRHLKELISRVENLEKGIVPDFEKARAAADAVNDFNAGISGILGFDPHEVLKKQRQDGGERA